MNRGLCLLAAVVLIGGGLYWFLVSPMPPETSNRTKDLSSKEPNQAESSVFEGLKKREWFHAPGSSDPEYTDVYNKMGSRGGCIVEMNTDFRKALLETYNYREQSSSVIQDIFVRQGSEPVETYQYWENGKLSDKKVGPKDPAYEALQRNCFPMIDELPEPGHRQLMAILGGHLPKKQVLYVPKPIQVVH